MMENRKEAGEVTPSRGETGKKHSTLKLWLIVILLPLVLFMIMFVLYFIWLGLAYLSVDLAR